MYKVSILVPVWGVEKYIERCARSLFEQTYNDIEYIFVNDCTKDNSIQILKEIIEQYPQRKNQVVIINHEINRGLAAARNTAVEISTGTFITHVDADDWLDISFVEKCIELQIKDNSDIVSADYMIHYKTCNTVQCETDLSDTKKILKDLLNSKVHGHIWARLIRSSIYKQNNILLKEGANFGEDLLGMTYLLFYAKSHAHINEPLYHYDCQNENSYSNTFSEKSSKQSLVNLNEARCFFQNHDINYLQDIDILEINKLLAHMIQCCRSDKDREYYNEVLLPAISKTDKKYWKRIKLQYRVLIYLKRFNLVRLYVIIADRIYRAIK